MWSKELGSKGMGVRRWGCEGGDAILENLTEKTASGRGFAKNFSTFARNIQFWNTFFISLVLWRLRDYCRREGCGSVATVLQLQRESATFAHQLYCIHPSTVVRLPTKSGTFVPVKFCWGG